MTDYRVRVVEGELAARMGAMGAVLVEGAKAVGKTVSAARMAKTVLRMDTDRAALAALEINPEQ
ncbi:MAG: ATP-binding protein, partial [Propionibacteriaceae bacterium]|nr:ATP-binding protein [Propionibacteriaceae bacterium]